MDTMTLQPIGSISNSIVLHKSHIQMPFARQGVFVEGLQKRGTQHNHGEDNEKRGITRLLCTPTNSTPLTENSRSI